jgi:predicted ArsR family transcriptional regulator
VPTVQRQKLFADMITRRNFCDVAENAGEMRVFCNLLLKLFASKTRSLHLVRAATRIDDSSNGATFTM